MLIERPLKVATPPTAACVVVPDSVPPGPAFVPITKVTLAVEAVRLPNWSSMRTVTDGVMGDPATAFVGCRTNDRAEAAAGVMAKAALVAAASPVVVVALSV